MTIETQELPKCRECGKTAERGQPRTWEEGDRLCRSGQYCSSALPCGLSECWAPCQHRVICYATYGDHLDVPHYH